MTDDRVEVSTIMRALDPEVFDAVWAAIGRLVPVVVEVHPLGCHRPRSSDRECFEVMLVRLSPVAPGKTVSASAGTRCRTRRRANGRDEWLAAGVFDAISQQAISAYDRVIRLDLSDVAVDGLRWPVERTNSWLSNFGQLRRNTDRRTNHRLAQLALAVAFPAHRQDHRLAKPLVTTPTT